MWLQGAAKSSKPFGIVGNAPESWHHRSDLAMRSQAHQRRGVRWGGGGVALKVLVRWTLVTPFGSSSKMFFLLKMDAYNVDLIFNGTDNRRCLLR